MPQFRRLVDAAGREWRVYEFAIYAGRTSYFRVGAGSGQYRGFVPVDGGARRRFLMNTLENTRDPSDETLLTQLAAATLDFRDDPARSAERGQSPERRDPSDG